MSRRPHCRPRLRCKAWSVTIALILLIVLPLRWEQHSLPSISSGGIVLQSQSQPTATTTTIATTHRDPPATVSLLHKNHSQSDDDDDDDDDDDSKSHQTVKLRIDTPQLQLDETDGNTLSSSSLSVINDTTTTIPSSSSSTSTSNSNSNSNSTSSTRPSSNSSTSSTRPSSNSTSTSTSSTSTSTSTSSSTSNSNSNSISISNSTSTSNSNSNSNSTNNRTSTSNNENENENQFQHAIRRYFQSLSPNDQNATLWIQDYLYWHDEMRRKFPDTQLLLLSSSLNSSTSTSTSTHDPTTGALPTTTTTTLLPVLPNLTILYMDPAKHHGGLTDRMKGIGHVLQLCHKQKRVLLLKWYDAPFALESFLVPHLFNWTLPDHPSLSTPQRLKDAYENNNNTNNNKDDDDDDNNNDSGTPTPTHHTHTSTPPRVKLIRFTNQLGNYLEPYGVVWHTYFLPSPIVQEAIDHALDSLGLAVTTTTTATAASAAASAENNNTYHHYYDAIHCRLGHPAYRDRTTQNAKVDINEGPNFNGINKVKAMKTASHALACHEHLLVETFPPKPKQRRGQQEPPHQLPVYFYSDSPDLVQAVLKPNQTRVVNQEQQNAMTTLVDWTTHRIQTIVGRPKVQVAHLEATQSSLQAHISTFVDLYIAIGARCVTMGVGRFAYMAAKISGTTCWTRHQTPSHKVSSQWGMLLMEKEVPECPLSPDD